MMMMVVVVMVMVMKNLKSICCLNQQLKSCLRLSLQISNVTFLLIFPI